MNRLCSFNCILYKKWFDHECKKMRLSLRNISNKKHRNPDDIVLREKYHETLKMYNALLKTKKTEFFNKNISLLEDSNFSTDFW